MSDEAQPGWVVVVEASDELTYYWPPPRPDVSLPRTEKAAQRLAKAMFSKLIGPRPKWRVALHADAVSEGLKPLKRKD